MKRMGWIFGAAIAMWGMTAHAQLLYSNNGTNYTAVVFAPGETNNNSYLIITNQTLFAGKITLQNIGTAAVFAVSSLTATNLPTVVTNPPAGTFLIPVGGNQVLSQWPLVIRRAWSCYTTNTGARGSVFITIDLP